VRGGRPCLSVFLFRTYGTALHRTSTVGGIYIGQTDRGPEEGGGRALLSSLVLVRIYGLGPIKNF
jgi:hypothetical protein